LAIGGARVDRADREGRDRGEQAGGEGRGDDPLHGILLEHGLDERGGTGLPGRVFAV